MEYNFERLIVWQKAMLLVRQVYCLSKTFPADERYALTDQLRRAVVSIPSNIAEGYGRSSSRDYAHFLSIARGSLYETVTQLMIAQGLGYCDQCDDAEATAGEITKMIAAMLKKFNVVVSSPRSEKS